MIWHTIPQAAETMGVTERTVKSWIRDGLLPVKRHDLVPGAAFVDDADLRRAEAAAHARKGGTTRFTRIDVPAGHCG